MASNAPDSDAAFIDNVRSRMTDHEGRSNHVYIDSKGHPTVGIGFNLDRPDAAAGLAAIGADYAAIRAGKVDLTDVQVNTLFAADLKASMQSAREVIANYDSLSDARRFVIVDMAFNLGKEGLSEFKGTIAAIERGDFAAAADHMENSLWYGQVKNRSVSDCAMMRSGDWTLRNERGSIVLPGHAAETAGDAHVRPLEYGSQGADVVSVQRKLGVYADGVFGPKTDQAVRTFQHSHWILNGGIFAVIYYPRAARTVCRFINRSLKKREQRLAVARQSWVLS